MGKSDRCVVFGCSNDRRYPEKYVVKEHVAPIGIKFFKAPDKCKRLWARLVNREGVAVLSDNQKVCSNHFIIGSPHGQHPHPVLFMRGYDSAASNDNSLLDIINSWNPAEDEEIYMRTRRGPLKRKYSEEKTAAKESTVDTKELPLPETMEASSDEEGDQCIQPPNYEDYAQSPQPANETVIESSNDGQCPENEHTYCMSIEHSTDNLNNECTCSYTCRMCKNAYLELQSENRKLTEKVRVLTEELRKINSEDCDTPDEQARYDISHIKGCDQKMQMHTGLTFAVFMWVFQCVAPKLPYIQYHRGSSSNTEKLYQKKKTQKPGPKRILSHENELLLVLMKLRQNLSEEFIAHLFCCSVSLVSQVLSTWLPLLALELAPLIYWPSQEQLEKYYPKCFHKYPNVRAIIDCTEIQVQRPSLAQANSQIYSMYKSRPTLKILVACTPAGTVSFISECAGGKMSDKEIVQRSNIIDKFDAGDTLLADRGFNIQELLLHKGVKLVIPPFLKKKTQFAECEDRKTKNVANARIHIERVIGRLKNFKIMQGPLPLNMIDLFDYVVTVVGALTNLQPRIVPLEC